MPKKPMKYGPGLKDGAKVPQHKALAMGIKPAQGVAQSKSSLAKKA